MERGARRTQGRPSVGNAWDAERHVGNLHLAGQGPYQIVYYIGVTGTSSLAQYAPFELQTRSAPPVPIRCDTAARRGVRGLGRHKTSLTAWTLATSGEIRVADKGERAPRLETETSAQIDRQQPRKSTTTHYTHALTNEDRHSG